MSSFKIGLFVFVLATIVLVQATEERKCVEGKTYNDGCNNCFCSGGNIGCTLMMCYTQDEATGAMRPYTRQEPPADFWEPIAEDNKA